MRKTISIFSAFCFLCILSCGDKDTSFLITENSVGPLSSETIVEDLDAVFSMDSISKDTAKPDSGKIQILQKNGNHLMTITSSTDSIPKVENIRIFDNRYKTNKGIGLSSTFQDIQNNYTIKKIVTTINSIVIFPKNSNLYFTIDKEELPSNLRYTTTKIEAVQIPATAKIKYLMLGWE